MSNTFRFRNDYRKAHFKNVDYNYLDRQEQSCKSKTTYMSERLATQQATTIMSSIDKKTGQLYEGPQLNVYRCSHCKNWHLTSQKVRKPNRHN